MALLNIGASNADDAFYRYKMPRLIAKVEGRGNGIRTNLVNMVDVAKALARPPAYTTKFFGCELGAQTKFDEKTGTSIVNGAHDTAKLAGLLEIFIKKFVQCYACGNPETEIHIKNGLINLQCKACGAASDVDMRHKLTTFILKNPPEKSGKKDKKDKQLRRAEKERIQAGEAIDEEEKKRAKEARRKKKEEKERKAAEEGENSPKQGSEDGEEDEEEVQWMTDTSAAAVKQRIQEQLTSVTSEMVTAGNGEVADESPSPAGNGHSKKKDKVASSPKEKTPRAKTPKLPKPFPDVGELALKSTRVEELKAFMEGNDVSATLAYLDEKEFSKVDQALLLFEALFSEEPKGIAKCLPKKKSYFMKFDGGADKQKHILSALEIFYGVTAPEVAKEIALVLKVFYDLDVVEEETILQWYDSGAIANNALGLTTEAGTEIRKHALPFVDWLRNASEEESDG